MYQKVQSYNTTMGKRRVIKIGETFGNLTIIKELPQKVFPNGKAYRMFECKCSCGNITNVLLQNLTRGHSTTCGHCGRISKERTVSEGDVFGRLTVIKEVESELRKDGSRKRNILCKCTCGNNKVVPLFSLLRGESRSCGCLARELLLQRSITHGLAKKHPLYTVWKGIKQRCLNSKSHAFKDYGGRGIELCEEWLSFDNFYNWCINNGWDKGKTIDRINNDMGYSPNNCRFVTMLEQNRNKRNNKSVEYNGRKWNSLAGFCEYYKLPYHRVQQQLCRGWSLEKVAQKYNM